MNTEALVTALIERQEREGWSDREMSRQLNVSHVTWRSVRIGRHGPGVMFIGRCSERFPELMPLLLLPRNASNTRLSRQSVSHPSEAA